jgi:hypothetical protein
MFRVFDAGRCHPPSELAVPAAFNRVLPTVGRIGIETSRLHFFAFHRSSPVVQRCDEKRLPNINGFVGSNGQPVGH